MEQQQYTPDWASIPPKYKWVAIDSDGWAYAFDTRPKTLIRSGIWINGSWSSKTEKLKTLPGEAWKQMLYKRPKPAAA